MSQTPPSTHRAPLGFHGAKRDQKNITSGQITRQDNLGLEKKPPQLLRSAHFLSTKPRSLEGRQSPENHVPTAKYMIKSRVHTKESMQRETTYHTYDVRQGARVCDNKPSAKLKTKVNARCTAPVPSLRTTFPEPTTLKDIQETAPLDWKVLPHQNLRERPPNLSSPLSTPHTDKEEVRSTT